MIWKAKQNIFFIKIIFISSLPQQWAERWAILAESTRSVMALKGVQARN